MPRQPYLKIVPDPKGGEIDVGTKSIGRRPELEVLIGRCLMAWTHAEAEMALFLGQILGAENAAAMALFQALRQSRSQRIVISEAAKAVLNAANQELLEAILGVHKSMESERNALAHGHFGTSSKLPNDLIWMNTNNYVTVRASIEFTPSREWNDQRHMDLLSQISVYRIPDLTKIFDDFKELGDIWFNLLRYAGMDTTTPRYAELYRQLCDRPHIRPELEKLRRENIRSTQPE